MSNEKGMVVQGIYISGVILPTYMGIIINHSKDPYQITSAMESKRVFSWLKWCFSCLLRNAKPLPLQVSEYDRQKIYTGWLEPRNQKDVGWLAMGKSIVLRMFPAFHIGILGKSSFLQLHRSESLRITAADVVSCVSLWRNLRHPSAHERKLLFARGNLHGLPSRCI